MTLQVGPPLIRYAYPAIGNYTYNYKVLDEDDLYVIHVSDTDVVTVLVLTTDYTANLAVDFANGSIDTTYVPDNANGSLEIRRIVDITQEVDFVNNDPFDMEILERALDKLTMICQQLQEELDRAVKVPIGTVVPVGGFSFPVPVDGFALVGNADGPPATGWINSAFTLQGYIDQAAAEADRAEAEADASAASAAAALVSENAADASAVDSAASASDSLGSANLAQKWAVNPEDVLVNATEYSAFHWAQKAAINSGMSWRDAWVDIPYARNDVVRDGEWTMIANKDTSERAAPQASGDKAYNVPESPAWTVTPEINVVKAGFTMQGIPDTHIVSKVRIWLEDITIDDHYQLVIYDATTGLIQASQIFLGTSVLVSGWIEGTITPLWVLPTDTYTFFVISERFNTTTDSNHPWNHNVAVDQEADPGPGQTSIRGDQTVLRINKTDSNTIDRTALVDSIVEGTVIRLVNNLDINAWDEFTVVYTRDNITWSSFDVILSASGPTTLEGVLVDIDFKVPVLQSINYPKLTNFYTTFPAFQGKLQIGNGAVVDSDDAFGVDVEIQQYITSNDWDLVAYSAVGSGGSGATNALIEVDTTINVPADHATVGEAYDSLDNLQFAADVIMTIKVADGTHQELNPIVAKHVQGKQIRILGNEAGSPGSCVLNFAADTEGFVAEDGYGFGNVSGFSLTQSPSTVSTNAIRVQRDGFFIDKDTSGLNSIVINGFHGSQILNTEGYISLAKTHVTAKTGRTLPLVSCIGGYTHVGLLSNFFGDPLTDEVIACSLGGFLSVEGATLTGGIIGIHAFEQGTIHADSVTVSDMSGTAVKIEQNSKIYMSNSTIDQPLVIGSIGIEALRGSLVEADALIVTSVAGRTSLCISVNNSDMFANTFQTTGGSYGLRTVNLGRFQGNTGIITSPATGGIACISQSQARLTGLQIVDCVGIGIFAQSNSKVFADGCVISQPVVAGTDGISAESNSDIICTSANITSVAGRTGACIVASYNSRIYANLATCTGGTRGLYAQKISTISAFDTDLTDHSSDAVLSEDGSTIYCDQAIIINCQVGLKASSGSTIVSVNTSISQGVTVGAHGINCQNSSRIYALNAIIQGVGRTGACVYTASNSDVNVSGGDLDNGVVGIQAVSNCRVHAENANINGCSNDCIQANRGSKVIALNTIVTNSGNHGCNALDNSSINNNGGTCTGHNVAGKFGYQALNMSFCYGGAVVSGNTADYNPIKGADGNSNSRIV